MVNKTVMRHVVSLLYIFSRISLREPVGDVPWKHLRCYLFSRTQGQIHIA